MDIEAFKKEIESFDDWMKEAVYISSLDKEKYIEELDDLIEDNGDVWDIVVTLHLINGDKIELHNNCMEAFIYGRYCGDTIYFDDDIAIADFHVDKFGHHFWIDNDDALFHQTRIPVENIVWIDSYSDNVRWALNRAYIINARQRYLERIKKC